MAQSLEVRLCYRAASTRQCGEPAAWSGPLQRDRSSACSMPRCWPVLCPTAPAPSCWRPPHGKRSLVPSLQRRRPSTSLPVWVTRCAGWPTSVALWDDAMTARPAPQFSGAASNASSTLPSCTTSSRRLRGDGDGGKDQSTGALDRPVGRLSRPHACWPARDHRALAWLAAPDRPHGHAPHLPPSSSP